METLGPATRDEIVALIGAGVIAPEHFVVPEGSEEWLGVSESEFADYLPQAVAADPVDESELVLVSEPVAAAPPLSPPKPKAKRKTKTTVVPARPRSPMNVPPPVAVSEPVQQPALVPVPVPEVNPVAAAMVTVPVADAPAVLEKNRFPAWVLVGAAALVVMAAAGAGFWFLPKKLAPESVEAGATESIAKLPEKNQPVAFRLPDPDDDREMPPVSGKVVETLAAGRSAGQGASSLKGPGGAVSLLPSQFIGKTFEECEKVLGPPVKEESAEGSRRALSRYYQAPLAGISRIRLLRVPPEGLVATVPETVNMVRYYFPKGEVKTLAEAFKRLGISTEGAAIVEFIINGRPVARRQWDTPFALVDSASVMGVEGRLHARWATAAESLMRVAADLSHGGEDSLTVEPEVKR